MDAYDHIQESTLAPSSSGTGNGKGNGGNGDGDGAQNTLNADFQDAYKAISSSPWGARLGGFFGSVVKQGEHVYKEASQELSAVGQEATKGLADLRSSFVGQAKPNTDPTDTPKDSTDPTTTPNEGVLARLRAEAAKRLKDIERAEDAADEALLRFGTGLRDFLREA
ncbi:hypothetical protein V493_07832, partial [Pseudogymnoascus sp. VKM F-4281 (FW-2241)]